MEYDFASQVLNNEKKESPKEQKPIAQQPASNSKNYDFASQVMGAQSEKNTTNIRPQQLKPKEEAPHINAYQQNLDESFSNSDTLKDWAKQPQETRTFAANHYKEVRGISQIMAGDGSDEEKIKAAKKQYPQAKFTQDAEGRYVTLNNKKLKILKSGDEGFKEFTLPFFVKKSDELHNPRYATNPRIKHEIVKNIVFKHNFQDIAARVQGDKNSISEFKKNTEMFYSMDPAKREKAEQYFKDNFGLDLNSYVEYGRDHYMNPILIVKKPFGYTMTGDLHTKPGKYYLNKPGISKGDFLDGTVPFLDETKLLFAGGAATAGMKWWAGIPTMGGIGMAQEGWNQTQRVAKGIGEYSLNGILMFGGFSALGEGVGRLVAPILSKIGRRIMGKKDAKVLDGNGDFTEEFKLAMKKKNIDLDELSVYVKKDLLEQGIQHLPDEQAARAIKLAELELKGTPGMITRDLGVQKVESTVAADPTGPHAKALREIYNANDEKIYQHVSNAESKIYKGGDDLEAGNAVQLHLRTQKEALKKESNKLITEATRGKAGATELSAPSKKHLLNSYRALTGRYGEGSLPDVVKDSFRKILSGEEKLTVSKVSELKNKLNDHWNKTPLSSSERSAQNIIAGLHKALRISVTKSKLSKSLSPEGRGAVEKLEMGYKKAQEKYTRFGQKGIVKDLIDEASMHSDRIATEKVMTRIMAAENKQLRALKTELKQTASGRVVWDKIRAGVARNLKETMREIDSIDTNIKRASFRRAWQSLVKTGKAKTFFNDSEIKLYNKINDVVVITTPIPGSVNYSGSGWSAGFIFGNTNIAAKLASDVPGAKFLTNLTGGYKEATKRNFSVTKNESMAKKATEGIKSVYQGIKLYKNTKVIEIVNKTNTVKEIDRILKKPGILKSHFPRYFGESEKKYSARILGKLKELRATKKGLLSGQGLVSIIVPSRERTLSTLSSVIGAKIYDEASGTE